MSLSHLKKIILADPYNALIFQRGEGRDLYLIGGYIRDTLMKRPAQDRDYILGGDIISFVQGIRTSIGGTLIKFKGGDTIRLALRDGTTFDFSRPRGSIEDDLRQRDFTINALAWSPGAGIIDVTGGISDISKKIVRGIAKENFNADPLRMIRAYRFAGEIGGTIDTTTRTYIKRLHDKISSVSNERITLEMFYLLNSPYSSPYLKQAMEDRVLTHIFPFPYAMLTNYIRDIFKLERRILEVFSHSVKVLLQGYFSQNLSYKGLLCLEILSVNQDILPQLQMSNAIVKRLHSFKKGYSFFRQCKKNDRTLFQLFMAAKDSSPDILIISNRIDLFREYRRFQRIWKKGLLSTPEIMKFSGISAGPAFGEIVVNIKRAEFIGLIRNRKQAKEMIKIQCMK